MLNTISPFTKWLCTCFLFIAIMIVARVFYSGNTIYLFLVWNLFLAWIPYLISQAFLSKNCLQKWKQIFLFCAWLLFFPNALYIVTDIIHIEATSLVPIWYDAILLFAASFAGLALAIASMKNIEIFLKKYFSINIVNIGILLLFFIGSFGVYLGRFQRWNSWDIFHNPIGLALDVASRFTSPITHTKTWGLTFLLTGLYAVCWQFSNVISLQNNPKN